MIEFGIKLPSSLSIRELTRAAKYVEDWGVNFIWLSGGFFGRNSLVASTVISYVTDRAKIGVLVNPLLINPVAIANFTLSLYELLGDRLVIGIQVDDYRVLKRLNISGIKPQNLLVESLYLVYYLLRGKKVTSRGYFKLNDVELKNLAENKIPIYAKINNPELIGSVKYAESVILSVIDSDFIIYAKSFLRGKKLGIDIPLSVDSLTRRAKKTFAEYSKTLIESFSDPTLKRYNLNKLSEESLAKIGVFGSPRACLKRLREIVKLGVNYLVFSPPYGPKALDSLYMFFEKVYTRIL